MTRRSTSETSSSAAFRKKLNAWYRQHGRHELPWRLTRDPYAVLVSEVMLQQTQVERVLPYYSGWLARWPDFESLASVPVAEAIRAWRGLGYNRRALNLHRLAVVVSEQHEGVLPTELAALLALPGVGEYTAAAVRCFAGAERVAVADTNIARLAARAALGVANQHEVPSKTLRGVLEGLLPRANSRDHNLALMDLGAMVCSARSPACEACTLAGVCRWRMKGYPQGERVAAAAEKFQDTPRFARGRIVDILREAAATAEELSAILPAHHQARTAEYLHALARDGMVVETDGNWSLPGPDRVYTPNRQTSQTHSES